MRSQSRIWKQFASATDTPVQWRNIAAAAHDPSLGTNRLFRCNPSPLKPKKRLRRFFLNS